MPRPMRALAAMALGVAGAAAAGSVARSARRSDIPAAVPGTVLAAAPAPEPQPVEAQPLPPRPVPERRSGPTWVLGGLGVVGGASVPLAVVGMLILLAVQRAEVDVRLLGWTFLGSCGAGIVGAVLFAIAAVLDERREARNAAALHRWNLAVGRAVHIDGGSSGYSDSSSGYYSYPSSYDGGSSSYDSGGYSGGSDGGGGGGFSSSY